jgi:hypothetical protein
MSAWVRGCLLAMAIVATGCGGGAVPDPEPGPAADSGPPPGAKQGTVAADFKVTPGTITLDWQRGETVVWYNDSDLPILIRFLEPDFEIAEIVQPKSWSCEHRAVAKGIHGYKIYKIETDGSLTDTSSDPPAEPKIDVGP